MPLVQLDQDEVIPCIICRHFPFCMLGSIRGLANAWAIAEFAKVPNLFDESQLQLARL
jgi:hypothetical protein